MATALSIGSVVLASASLFFIFLVAMPPADWRLVSAPDEAAAEAVLPATDEDEAAWSRGSERVGVGALAACFGIGAVAMQVAALVL